MTRKERAIISKKKRVNAIKKKRYNIVLKATGDSTLASNSRGWSDKHIAEVYTDARIRNNKLVYVNPKTEAENLRLRVQYDKAVDKGYTFEEAQSMRSWNAKKFTSYLKENKILNLDSRLIKWRSMARRKAYDSWIINEAKRVNLERGYDEDARFGWNAVYVSYTEGGSVDEWAERFMADPMNRDIYEEKGVVKRVNRPEKREYYKPRK